jgi:hypothetical protein
MRPIFQFVLSLNNGTPPGYSKIGGTGTLAPLVCRGRLQQRLETVEHPGDSIEPAAILPCRPGEIQQVVERLDRQQRLEPVSGHQRGLAAAG